MDTSRSQSELSKAIADFKLNYQKFASKNNQYILIEDDFQSAFQKAQEVDNIKHATQLFGEAVRVTFRIVERKKKLTESKWTHKVGDFLTKLYPVARLSFDVTAAVAEVLSPFNHI